jgi:hypothetical protein
MEFFFYLQGLLSVIVKDTFEVFIAIISEEHARVRVSKSHTFFARLLRNSVNSDLLKMRNSLIR